MHHNYCMWFNIYPLSTVRVPTVTVALDNPGSPLLAETSRSLVCSFNPMGLTTNVTWTKNHSVAVDTSDNGRVTVNTVVQSNSTLTFNPLSTSDGAKYECMITVMAMGGNPSTYTFSAMIDLNVTSEYCSIYSCIYYSSSFSCSLHQMYSVG